MVARFAFGSILLAGLALAQNAFAANIPFYRVGDVATNDVVTPIPLMVTDPVATALHKEKEQQDVRYIVRYAPSITDEAERAFRSQMALLREEFVRELTIAYGKSKVDKSVERTPKFLELTGRFREEHKGTPKLFLYMPYWAQGRSDEHLLVDWVGYIRRTMDRPIRQDSLPPGEVGTTVRMITVPDLEVQVQLEHAERYGVMTPVDNIVPLAQARRDMAAAFPTDDAYISKFLEPFVRPNCVFDAELTGESRERLAASLVVAVNYAAGDKVVKAGQVIDAKTVAALDALRNQLPEPAASEPLVTPAPVPKESRDWVWMVLAGTGGGGFVLISYLLLARRKSPQSSALVSKGNSSYTTSLSATDGGRTAAEWVPDRGAVIEGETERGWRERALAAESRAEKARELARTKVTDALKDKVVQHLSSQRDELIDDQLSAAEQMVGMEARLEKIQGPLSERLQAYEARIAELEDQLAIKDQENRALIQAKLENIRDQIARAKAARSFEWN